LRSLLEHLQHAIEAEGAALLAGRVLLEGGQELSDVLLRRHEEEHVLEHPSLIVHALVVRGLERIRAQIEELGQEFLRAREVQHQGGQVATVLEQRARPALRPPWPNVPDVQSLSSLKTNPS